MIINIFPNVVLEARFWDLRLPILCAQLRLTKLSQLTGSLGSGPNAPSLQGSFSLGPCRPVQLTAT